MLVNVFETNTLEDKIQRNLVTFKLISFSEWEKFIFFLFWLVTDFFQSSDLLAYFS